MNPLLRLLPHIGIRGGEKFALPFLEIAVALGAHVRRRGAGELRRLFQVREMSRVTGIGTVRIGGVLAENLVESGHRLVAGQPHIYHLVAELREAGAARGSHARAAGRAAT